GPVSARRPHGRGRPHHDGPEHEQPEPASRPCPADHDRPPPRMGPHGSQLVVGRLATLPIRLPASLVPLLGARSLATGAGWRQSLGPPAPAAVGVLLLQRVAVIAGAGGVVVVVITVAGALPRLVEHQPYDPGMRLVQQPLGLAQTQL